MVSTPEPLEGALDGLLHVRRTAVQARRTLRASRIGAGTEIEPELGGDDDLAANGREGLAHELFVRERTIAFRGVEERDAALHGGPEKPDHLLLLLRRAVGKAHPHAAEAQGRDFQVAPSELASVHRCKLFAGEP